MAPAMAQVSASGTMIEAPSTPKPIVRGAADAIPQLPETPGSSPSRGNSMQITHPLVLHPVMPSLPVILPPRNVSTVLSGGMPPNPHAGEVKPVNLATGAAATGAALSPSAPANAPTSLIGSVAQPSPGQLPPPRIDPSIGDAPAAPRTQTDTQTDPRTQIIAPTAQTTSATPAPAASGAQNDDVIRATAEQFLREQTAGLPGQIGITVNTVAPRGLAACDTLEAFLPPGAHLWGRATVGVRCIGAHPWTLYLQARISVNATYFVASREIAAGATITAADLTPRQGDLTNLPRTTVTDLAQIVGKASLERIAPGLLLRQDMARAVTLVQAGQSVKLVVQGSGFSISYEGSAMNNAAAGESVKVRTPSGQIVSGVVKDQETVEIPL